jgi:dihydroflavonol-4-reductase
VLTSSFAAVGYGHGTLDREFTEEDWTNVDGRGITAYVKSKVLAERAAWDFINSEGRQTELTFINPVATFGPVFSDDLSTNVSFPIADVRDVADVHRCAMTHPAAAGERFIVRCDGGPITMLDAAYILRDWTRVGAVIGATVIGDIRRPSNRKAKVVLGWTPRQPIAEAILSIAGSLVRVGLIEAA